MYSRPLLFVLALYTISCSDRPVDGKAVQQEMESREIKRVSDAVITNQALQLAGELLSVQSPSKSMKYPLDTLSADDLDDAKRPLLEAYEFQMQSGEELVDFAEKIGNNTFIYHPLLGTDSTIKLIRLQIPVKDVIQSL